MSDAELDREFEATNNSLRPQSQIARNFADQLNDIFLLDDSLDKLDRTINRKKQSVSYQNSELALLEARIKQAERLLEEKKASLQQREVPDYESNPNFTATPDAEPAQAERNGEVKEQQNGGEREYVVVDREQYQVRPPPPPPSVPTSI